MGVGGWLQLWCGCLDGMRKMGSVVRLWKSAEMWMGVR